MLLHQNPGKKKNTNGRWSQVQHDRFMKALQKYGGDWVSIQKHVKSRTVTQVRSHAQKVFLKMDQRDIDELLYGEQGLDQSTEIHEQRSRVQTKREKIERKEKTSLAQSLRKLVQESGERQQEASQKQQKLLKERKDKVEIPNVNQSFFLQIFRQNERYFFNGGNFLPFINQQKIENKSEGFRVFGGLSEEMGRGWVEQKKEGEYQ